MAQIARGGEKRRPCGIRRRNRRRAGSWRRAPRRSGPIVVVQREREDRQIVIRMVSLAEPRADDHRRDGRMIERPARRDVGDRDAVLRSRSRRARARIVWNAPQPPAASTKRLYFILLQSAISSLAGSGRPSQRSDMKAAGERAIGEQPHAVLEAEGAHLPRRAAVEERKAHLVADDRECRASPARAGAPCRNW